MAAADQETCRFAVIAVGYVGKLARQQGLLEECAAIVDLHEGFWDNLLDRGFQAAVARLDKVIVAEMQASETETDAIATAADNAFDAGAVLLHETLKRLEAKLGEDLDRDGRIG